MLYTDIRKQPDPTVKVVVVTLTNSVAVLMGEQLPKDPVYKDAIVKIVHMDVVVMDKHQLKDLILLAAIALQAFMAVVLMGRQKLKETSSWVVLMLLKIDKVLYIYIIFNV